MESQDHLADNKVRNEQVGGGGEVGGSPVSLHNPLYCGSNVILNQTQNSIKEKRCAVLIQKQEARMGTVGLE